MTRLGTLAVLAAALLLSGCGFRPLYGVPGGSHATMQDTLGAIYVEPVPERLGYTLRNQLIDLLDARGDTQGAQYRLRLTLARKSEAVGVQAQPAPGGLTQTAITRYNDTLTVDYELIDIKTDEVLTKGTESGLSAYNVLQSPYATLVMQQDADKRAADDIADRIRVDLAVYFAQRPKP